MQSFLKDLPSSHCTLEMRQPANTSKLSPPIEKCLSLRGIAANFLSTKTSAFAPVYVILKSFL